MSHSRSSTLASSTLARRTKITTIAFDGVSICADSLTTAGGVRLGHMSKIHETENGIVACAGDVAACHAITEWISGGARKKYLPSLEDGAAFDVVWIDKKKRVWSIDTALIPFPACVPIAEGSGADFALAAMVSGMRAYKAVELAIKLDCFSGGEIQEVFI